MIMCTSIQKISAMDLEKIMYGSDRLDNQIIDVRERGDFECASGYNTDIINLPLSKSYKWSREVVDGKFLSPKKRQCVYVQMVNDLQSWQLFSVRNFVLHILFNHYLILDFIHSY